MGPLCGEFRQQDGTTFPPVMGPPGGPPVSVLLRLASPPDRQRPRQVAMSFREVRVFEIREVLRLWLRGDGLRSIERLAAVDRKTVRRYVQAAVELGLVRDGSEGQLTDGFIGQVCERV